MPPRKLKKAVILLPPDMEDSEVIVEMIPVALEALEEEDDNPGSQPDEIEQGD